MEKMIKIVLNKNPANLTSFFLLSERETLKERFASICGNLRANFNYMESNRVITSVYLIAPDGTKGEILTQHQLANSSEEAFQTLVHDAFQAATGESEDWAPKEESWSLLCLGNDSKGKLQMSKFHCYDPEVLAKDLTHYCSLLRGDGLIMANVPTTEIRVKLQLTNRYICLTEQNLKGVSDKALPYYMETLCQYLTEEKIPKFRPDGIEILTNEVDSEGRYFQNKYFFLPSEIELIKETYFFLIDLIMSGKLSAYHDRRVRGVTIRDTVTKFTSLEDLDSLKPFYSDWATLRGQLEKDVAHALYGHGEGQGGPEVEIKIIGSQNGEPYQKIYSYPRSDAHKIRTDFFYFTNLLRLNPPASFQGLHVEQVHIRNKIRKVLYILTTETFGVAPDSNYQTRKRMLEEALTQILAEDPPEEQEKVEDPDLGEVEIEVSGLRGGVLCFETFFYPLSEAERIKKDFLYYSNLLWSPTLASFNGRHVTEVSILNTVTNAECTLNKDSFKEPLSYDSKARLEMLEEVLTTVLAEEGPKRIEITLYGESEDLSSSPSSTLSYPLSGKSPFWKVPLDGSFQVQGQPSLFWVGGSY